MTTPVDRYAPVAGRRERRLWTTGAIDTRWRACVFFCVTLVLAAQAHPVFAQTVDTTHLSTLAVTGTPAGLLGAAGITTPIRARADLFLHLIHRLYGTSNDDTPALRGLRSYTRTVAAFMDAWRSVRAADGTASLQPVQDDRRARSRLEDLVEVAGFRLRRRSGRRIVERDDGSDANARRETLRAAGVDVEDLDVRLNGGEALTFEIPSFEIPLPLAADVWLDAVIRDREMEESLGFRLLADRRAALLYYGLTSMTPETLQFLSANRRLLRDLYEDHADALATYGRSLVVENGRVVAPGGPEAAELWRSLASERVEDPDDFIKAILRHDDGVLAFFYDAVAHMDEPHRRFVLGLELDERRRRSQFWRLYDVMLASTTLLPERPFTRTFPEPSVLLSQVAVDAAGRPDGPAWTDLWEEAFSGSGLPRDPARDLRNVERSEPIDAAWLAEQVFEEPGRLDARAMAFLFAQRRFGAAPVEELPDVLVTLRGFQRFRSLVLTLDRMDVQRPSIYAAAVRHAVRIDEISDREQSRDALSQFQGVVALLDRVRHVRSLSGVDAGDLVESLSAIQVDRQRGYEGRVADWIARTLLPALEARRASRSPKGDGPASADGTNPAGGLAPRERIVVEMLAGALDEDGVAGPSIVQWAGFSYVAVLLGALLRRLALAREAQAGNSLDTALDLWAVAASLARGPATVDAVRRETRALEALRGRLRERPNPGSVSVAEYAFRARSDLRGIDRPRDVERRAPEVGRRLQRLADAVLGDVLRSILYAAYVGDPRSGVLDGGDLSAHHDFGTELPGDDARRFGAWRFPGARMVPDRPWHAVGALLGLDLPTMHLRLAQVITAMPPVRQVLDVSDRDAMVATATLFNSFDRSTAEIDTIARAIGSGRARMARMAAAPEEIDAVASAAGLSAWRHALLGWIAVREPEQIETWLSVRELFWLGWQETGIPGRGSVSDTVERLRGWGAYSGPLNGCLCLSLVAPQAQWENWRGRAGGGLVATLASDLSLWVAEGLYTRGLPTTLAGAVLEVAMRHLLDRVRPLHPDDWDTVLRYPSTLTAADFDDYVSSLTGTDVLRPAEDPSVSP